MPTKNCEPPITYKYLNAQYRQGSCTEGFLEVSDGFCIKKINPEDVLRKKMKEIGVTKKELVEMIAKYKLSVEKNNKENVSDIGLKYANDTLNLLSRNGIICFLRTKY